MDEAEVSVDIKCIKIIGKNESQVNEEAAKIEVRDRRRELGGRGLCWGDCGEEAFLTTRWYLNVC